MGGETQQVFNGEMFLPAPPRHRLQLELLDPARDSRRADVDQLSSTGKSREGADVVGSTSIDGRHGLSSLAQDMKELKVSSEKRTTGLEPATSSLGSSRSTN